MAVVTTTVSPVTSFRPFLGIPDAEQRYTGIPVGELLVYGIQPIQSTLAADTREVVMSWTTPAAWCYQPIEIGMMLDGDDTTFQYWDDYGQYFVNNYAGISGLQTRYELHSSADMYHGGLAQIARVYRPVALPSDLEHGVAGGAQTRSLRVSEHTANALGAGDAYCYWRALAYDFNQRFAYPLRQVSRVMPYGTS